MGFIFLLLFVEIKETGTFEVLLELKGTVTYKALRAKGDSHL